MDEQERARQIYRVIEAALAQVSQPAGGAVPAAGEAVADQEATGHGRVRVTRESGCLACDPGQCWECGYFFSGERIIIHHDTQGERVLSDKTFHLLSHGITRYRTKYVVYGEPVIVDLNVEELAAYLDL